MAEVLSANSPAKLMAPPKTCQGSCSRAAALFQSPGSATDVAQLTDRIMAGGTTTNFRRTDVLQIRNPTEQENFNDNLTCALHEWEIQLFIK